MNFRQRMKDTIRVKNFFIRAFLAEFLGTFTLIVFGCGANAQYVLSRQVAGTYLTTNLAWGLAAAMGTWVSFEVTGAHINPAVTLAMVTIGRRTFQHLLVYWSGQYLGAFVASAVVFGVYRDALDNFDGGIRSVVGQNATAGIWATYPQPYLSQLSGFGDQVLGTMLLMMCCMGVVEKFRGTGTGMLPLGIGGVVAILAMTFTFNCGGAINPARDFSPRVFTAIAGWGGEVFTVYSYWFWVPLVAPHIGAVLGAWVYLAFVAIHAEPTDV